MNIWQLIGNLLITAMQMIFTTIPSMGMSIGSVIIFCLIMVFIGSWILEDPGTYESHVRHVMGNVRNNSGRASRRIKAGWDRYKEKHG